MWFKSRLTKLSTAGRLGRNECTKQTRRELAGKNTQQLIASKISRMEK